MSIRLRIRILTGLMIFFNLSLFLAIDYRENVLPQLVLYFPIVFLVFLLLYFFDKGRNWARILVLIGAVLNLVFFIPSLFQGAFQALLALLEAPLSVYLLFFLNQNAAKAFFQPGPDIPPKKAGVPLWGKIVVTVVLIALLAGGGIWYFISKTLSSVQNMEVWLEDIGTEIPERLTQDGANASPVFSPDGTQILFVHGAGMQDKRLGTEIRLLGLRERNVETVLRDGFANYTPLWAPDSRSFYYVSRRNDVPDLWRLDLADRSSRRITTDGRERSDLRLSPDGKWFLFTQKPSPKEEKELFLMPAEGGEPVRLTRTDHFLNAPQNPSWSPDSREIVYVGFVSLVVIDLEGKVIDRIDLAGLNNIASPLFDPADPDRIFFKARGAQSPALTGNLYVVYRKARAIDRRRKSGLFEVGFNFSPDGKKVVYSKPGQ